MRSGFACVGEKGDGNEEKGGDARSPRWSDCGCEACLSWQEKGKEELHLVVMDACGDKMGIKFFRFYSILSFLKLT